MHHQHLTTPDQAETPECQTQAELTQRLAAAVLKVGVPLPAAVEAERYDHLADPGDLARLTRQAGAELARHYLVTSALADRCASNLARLRSDKPDHAELDRWTNTYLKAAREARKCLQQAVQLGQDLHLLTQARRAT